MKKMQRVCFIKFFIFICAFFSVAGVMAQDKNLSAWKSQEVSDADGVPVLLKHLPKWESIRNAALHTDNANDLRKALGERPIFDLIDFAGGTEAVTAPYPQGKLLIIEYNTPQASVDADNKFNQRLAEIGQNPPIFYRRIGNYNAFVFDAADEASANSLLDQVKYEKDIQWLGSNPFLLRRAERVFIKTTSDLFIATTVAIAGGLGIALLTGILVGIVYFYFREQKRSTMEAFSDAGGMIRLNLDGLTPQTSTDRLLKD